MSEAQKVLFGVFTVLVLSIAVVPLGGLLGYAAGNNGIGWWLFATGTPLVFFGAFALLVRPSHPAYAKGVLIGLCIAFLVTGICNGIATDYGREVPSIESW